MASLVIRNIEDELHRRLKAQAAAHSHSMEEEARVLLRRGLAALPSETPQKFGQAMRAIFEPLGGVEFPEVPSETPGEPLGKPPGEPPDFSGPEWDPPA